MADLYLDVARDALGWVARAAVAAEGGVCWPSDLTPEAQLSDHVYDGTAGVLISLCEARVTGLTEFDEVAAQAAGRLRWVLEHEADSAAEQAATRQLTEIVAHGRANRYNDILSGEAGILAALADLGGPDLAEAGQGASAIADRLVGEALWEDGEPDWDIYSGFPVRMPGFSHGAAGIGFALARAGSALGRPDLIDVAVLAANRLVRLGSRPDGTLLVPNRGAATAPDDPLSYGWCHGPTGTLRLFSLLERLRPGQGWAAHAQACRQAVRASGLPARLFPGFWDNIAQCCGTAGVAEMALDTYQEASDPDWLAWADRLAQDILSRRISDASGVRWSNTEFRADPAELPPAVGWMQGAAGVAGFLLRLARVHAEGPAARQLAWPDQPAAHP